MYHFNAAEETSGCIKWIKDWFEKESGGAKGAVVGISGGKDSAVCAGLCAEAIGRNKVYGLLLPNGVQADISDSERVCEIIGIDCKTINIAGAYNAIVASGGSAEAGINTAPRIRMTALYFTAQTMNYRVAGTGNLSEKYIGYFTKWGDAACDFNPLADFTTDEVIEVGEHLGLPAEITRKTPSDGLCGLSDEEKIGFSYAELNKFIRTGECENEAVKAKIEHMHALSLHKTTPVPYYPR